MHKQRGTGKVPQYLVYSFVTKSLIKTKKCHLENLLKISIMIYFSPIGSPSESSQHQKTLKSPDSTKLKALSAESLRSVSPGSDSVFYSDPSSHAAIDQQVGYF